MTQLSYFSDKVLAQLRRDIAQNLDRYLNTGFQDFAGDPGWDVSFHIEIDKDRLADLDLSTPANASIVDLANSKAVGEALIDLNPADANEERIWARLAHFEAIDYCRARWLSKPGGRSLDALVRTHFFAPTQTGIRDDHAISRLWWNYQIAKTCEPDNVDGALGLLLTTADIRSNFVERIWMTSRRRIAGAVLRAMRSEPWIVDTEKNFREFMKTLNRLGGGVVFEALSDVETDEFVLGCVQSTRLEMA